MANENTWANGFIKSEGDLKKYGQSAYAMPTTANGRMDTSNPEFMKFMSTATPEQINAAGNQWNFNAQQTDRYGTGVNPNAGVGSLHNNISWMPTNTYQQYIDKQNVAKASQDPLSAWLSAGSTPMTEAEYNAQNARAGASPTSFGGGSSQNLGMGGGSGGVMHGGPAKLADNTNWQQDVTGQNTGNSTGMTSGGGNPYLQDMGQNIMAQMTDNYTRNQLPAMRSGAMAAGGFGGSRQGVVEANGLRDLNLGIGQNLTNLYGTDWTNQQNRDLSYAGLDSQNAQFGANYGLNVLNSQTNWANNGVNATTQMQNTPTNYQTMFSNNQNAIAGQGGTQTNTQNNQGNPWLGGLGGLQLANSWLKG